MITADTEFYLPGMGSEKDYPKRETDLLVKSS